MVYSLLRNSTGGPSLAEKTMSTLRQPCPACHRELQLPEHAVGRLAQCPACQAEFRVGVDREHALRDDTLHPFRAPLAAGSSVPAANPYQPSVAVDSPLSPVARSGQVDIFSRTIDEVISPTMSIFGARWLPLLLISLVTLMVLAVAIGVPAGVLVLIAQGASDAVAGVLFLALLPIMMFVTAYLSVGICRACVAIARNDPSPFSQLLPPLAPVLRFVGGSLAMLATLCVMGGVLVGLGFLVAMATDPNIVGPLLAVLGVVVLLLGSLVAQWLLWPWVFVVSDEQGTTLGSIGTGYQIAMHNKLTSLLLVIVSMVLSMVGSACYIGQLITTPLTILMFGVAYLQMTNQGLDDPRQSSLPREDVASPTAGC